MTAFMSTITGKIDAKGRVSVPSVFRSVIAAQNGDRGSHGIFLYPSFIEAAIDGGGATLMNDIHTMVDNLDSYTEEHAALATALFADSHHLLFDGDGRVSLPASLLSHAEIDKTLCFVGLGGKFQIWNPSAYAAFRQRARTKALASRNLLRSPTGANMARNIGEGGQSAPPNSSRGEK